MEIAKEMTRQLQPLIINSGSQLKRTLNKIQEKQEEEMSTIITNLNTGMNMMTETLQRIQTKMSLLEVEISTINLKQKLKHQASLELLSKIDNL